MSVQRDIMQYFIDKLNDSAYNASFGYASPQFGRTASFVEVWAGNEEFTMYNGTLPPEAVLPLEFYVCYFIGNDMNIGEWYDWTQTILECIVDNPSDRASAEYFWWSDTTITVDRHTSLRRFDSAQEDSRGFAVARIDVDIHYLTRGPLL